MTSNLRTFSVIRKLFFALLALLFASNVMAEEKLVVFAAASLTNALSEISANYEKETGIKISHSFASSSTLAKQIENGAPADLFISADLKWMNYLQDKSLIIKSSRKNLLGNQLVLISPKGKSFEVKFDKAFDFSKAFEGRLCTGDLDSVPVGIYAKEALTNLGWWNDIKSRIVGTQDVRGALAFVERAECNVGIVYQTDAKISSKVDLVAVFPDSTHSPVLYPVAATASSKNNTNSYLTYLQSAEVLSVFKKYGFNINPKQ
jgi:molybdate transport system substrate-binding protein